MLTHIGALVGCHCGNPRDPQIVAEGLFSREHGGSWRQGTWA